MRLTIAALLALLVVPAEAQQHQHGRAPLVPPGDPIHHPVVPLFDILARLVDVALSFVDERQQRRLQLLGLEHVLVELLGQIAEVPILGGEGELAAHQLPLAGERKDLLGKLWDARFALVEEIGKSLQADVDLRVARLFGCREPRDNFFPGSPANGGQIDRRGWRRLLDGRRRWP